jgi:hypothetical protein
MTARLAAWLDEHEEAVLVWGVVACALLLAFTLVYAALCAVGLAS